jgi:hypothetical protein
MACKIQHLLTQTDGVAALQRLLDLPARPGGAVGDAAHDRAPVISGPRQYR